MRGLSVLVGSLLSLSSGVAGAQGGVEDWIATHPDVWVGAFIALLVVAIVVAKRFQKKARPESPPQVKEQVPGASANPFGSLKLKQFVSTGSGLVFRAPESWTDASDEELFRVVDPATKTQFTSSAYANPGLPLEQWATHRNEAVTKGMPYFTPVGTPYRLATAAGPAMVAEYVGTTPDYGKGTRYLVLCLITPKMLISFTITAAAAPFANHEKLYRWLIKNNLDIYKVVRQQATAH